jgi:hypothetical protein
MKPCSHCTVNIEQAAFEGSVTCYLTCEKWREWREKVDKGEVSHEDLRSDSG